MTEIPVDRTQRTLTDGSPVPDDQSHTQDRGDGQQKGYVVLSAEERAKGFVRPIRLSYRHRGAPAPKYPLRDLTAEEKERYLPYNYVKYEEYPQDDGTSILGMFWTQDRLDNANQGCGVATIMGQALAETYARDPKFYSSTFCCGCGTHLPLDEFVWDGTAERVGS